MCRGADGVFRERGRAVGGEGNAFRGSVSYQGDFAGWTQTEGQRRQARSLGGLLRGALTKGASKTEVSGKATLSLNFAGNQVQGQLRGSGLSRFSYRLTGQVQNGQCRLSDPANSIILAGQCNKQGFRGQLTDAGNQRYRTKSEILFSLTASNSVDLDQRDFERRVETESRNAEVARERAQEANLIEQLRLDAEAGGVKQMRQLGGIYGGRYRDIKFIRVNHRESSAWYARAAQRGDPESQFQLGFNYIKGRGVRKDGAAAYNLMARCAKSKSNYAAQCQRSQGIILFLGDGVPADKARARQVWQQCSALGDKTCAELLRDTAGQ